MRILVNGKEENVEKELTVKELLDTLSVEMQDYVTVQLNGELISREEFETITVENYDTVEFLYFMGGGEK